MNNTLDPGQFSSDISNTLQEFKSLHSAHEENKKGHKELSEFVALLQEELKLARDAERTADFKKSRCQAYVSQQQEVILKLLSVKEENESLKQNMRQMEITLSAVQNNSMAEHVKKEAEIQEIKQDYLKEFLKVQETANSQVNKVKADLSSTLEELKSTINKNQEIIEKQENMITVLKSEIEDLKVRSSINVEIYQKKLADQERMYQAELDTWKMAELNRQNFESKTQNTNVVTQYSINNCPGSIPYQSGMQSRQVPDYSPSLSLQSLSNKQISSSNTKGQSSTYKNQPFIFRSKNVSRILQNNVNKNVQGKDFLSANEFYLRNQDKTIDESEENEEEDLCNKLFDNSNEATTGQTSKSEAPKRRKLLNPNENFL